MKEQYPKIKRLFKDLVYSLYFNTSAARKTQSPVNLTSTDSLLPVKNVRRLQLSPRKLSFYTKNYFSQFNLDAANPEIFDEIADILNDYNVLYSRNTLSVLAELCYHEGYHQKNSNTSHARQYFLSSAYYAFHYLFNRTFAQKVNQYSPQFRFVCELYNHSLSEILNIIFTSSKRFSVPASYPFVNGKIVFKSFESELYWNIEDLLHLISVYNYIPQGLLIDEVNYGIGVPAIAAIKNNITTGNEKSLDKYVIVSQENQYLHPVTGIITFNDLDSDKLFDEMCVEADIKLYNPYKTHKIQINTNDVPLEVDFSGTIGFYMNRKSQVTNLQGLLDPGNEAVNPHKGLLMPTCYDPKKIPVILCHGLVSTLKTWDQTLNILLNSPFIRDHYQFCFYSYPSGLPVLYSAHLLRESLKQFYALYAPITKPNIINNTVLIGHSLGGVISKLQTQQGGEAFLKQIITQPLDGLNLDSNSKSFVRNMIYFEPLDFIKRCILIATPHQGSDFASNSFSRFSSSLIELPEEIQEQAEAFFREIRNIGAIKYAPEFYQIRNGIDCLEKENKIFDFINNLPLSENVIYHSIIGDEKKAGKKNGSDGIVPYHSSHVDFAESEKIIKSDHAVHKKAACIMEIEQILLKHITRLL